MFKKLFGKKEIQPKTETFVVLTENFSLFIMFITIISNGEYSRDVKIICDSNSNFAVVTCTSEIFEAYKVDLRNHKLNLKPEHPLCNKDVYRLEEIA